MDGLTWRDPGDDLPALRLSISTRDYVLDAEEAEDLAFYLVQPPVERVRRIYTIEEAKRSAHHATDHGGQCRMPVRKRR